MSAPRRFWRDVDIASGTDGHAVRLDDKPVRLPGGAPLVLASRPLAEAIAVEWRAIGPGAPVVPDAIPLTRIAGTMIERVTPDPAATRATLLGIGLNDLLCYRTGGALGQAQAEGFDPWLDWLAARGARLRTTTGILPITQTDAARAGLTALLQQQDVAMLASLGVATQAGGSLVLALALTDDAIETEACLELCVLDERFQLRDWGPDAELEATITRKRADLGLARQFAMLGKQ